MGDTFTLEHLHTLPMVVTYREPTAFTPAVKQLHMVGIEPRVVAVSESFLALPFLVAGTDRFALIQQRLASTGSRPPRTSGSCPCPFPVTPLVEALWWHPVYERDAGHQWLRDRLRPRPRPSATRDGLTRVSAAPIPVIRSSVLPRPVRAPSR